MEFTVGLLLTFLATFLIIALSVFYFYHTKDYNYWTNRGVPNIRPVFPFGSTRDLVLAKTFIGKGYNTMYQKFSKERFFGIIDVQNPVLVLRDPELIKAVLVKDFNHFAVRTNVGANSKEYILRHVINMNGQEWKDMRMLLTPAFTSGKMKSIFVLMEKCSKQLNIYLHEAVGKNPVVEVTNVFARFTMDVIATSAFGVETDSINNENCQFFTTVGSLLKTTKARFFRRFLVNFFPTLVKFLPVQLIPPDVTDLLTNSVRQSVVHREKNNIKRSDFLNVLIESKKYNGENLEKSTSVSKPSKGLTIEEMTAQAFVFFIAGYTTDTSVMSFCLYELSIHADIQEALYQNIQEAVDKHNGAITYESLQDMPYLDQVVNETLRLYGSGQIIIRTCTERYNIPNTNIHVEKGVRVIIPSYSLHHDPVYFPDPDEFRPERFTPEKVKERHPFVFLPFGEGPRNCIGRNFGMLQIKIGLATVISNFKVDLSPEQEVPINIDTRSIVVTPANPVLLRFTPRKMNGSLI
ncbi:probable cytochrome P450 6a13 [Homalodisca vitripennis]|uniref:probable cytochrome P450 6a13 n=1 Tax=Homalodisca vitripennis TaxID=197043 RepID=UPI001EEB1E1D|nr:probable cytochrome P450 6a13 [Homalodisca vitripennis]XP_046678175.1 probable cytochrome P450 6a13 [Homalodisca vitripennis]